MRLIRTFRPTLIFKLIAGILFIIIPVVVVSAVTAHYSVSVVKEQVAQSNKNLLTLYMNQIDRSLADVDTFLYDLFLSDSDISTIGERSDARTQEYDEAKLRLFNVIKSNIGYYEQVVDLLFIYSVTNDELATTEMSGGTFTEREQLRDAMRMTIRTHSEVAGNDESWEYVELDGRYYLFQLISTDTASIGAWVSVDKLMLPLSLINLGENGRALFVTKGLAPMTDRQRVEDEHIDLTYQPAIYYTSGKANNYLVMGEPSTKGPFSLVALIPDNAVLDNIPYLQGLSMLVTVCTIVSLIVFVFYMRSIFLLPIWNMIRVMRAIKRGDLSSRIALQTGSIEFRMMGETFNEMVNEIEDLKINVYEEKLNHQKAELKHLQLQINPHFFLNSLNIVFNLAILKDFKLIKEMTTCLVHYFRFMFSSNSDFVTVGDELAHTANYLRIQQLRFIDTFSYRIEADEQTKGCAIPPLIIQTLVENTIKHALDAEERLELLVRVAMEEREGESWLYIFVQDTGKGFPEHILTELEQSRMHAGERNEHIGLWNIQRRLEFMYPGRMQIDCWNAPGKGATVSILIPAESDSTKGDIHV